VRRGIWITLAGLVVFAAILVARLPASWVVPSGPKAPFACGAVEGSLWSGACSGLTAQHLPLGNLAWELRPARLLAAKLAAHVTLTRGSAHANGDFEWGLGDHLTARNLTAALPLDPTLLPGLPATLRGNASLDLSLAELTHGIATQLQGTIEVRNLEDHAGNRTPLGSYSVRFPGGEGEPVGQIRDLGGPLSVTGTLKLTHQGGYEVEGLVAARPDAPPELINNMRYLGSPDAAGRRPFSLSGTF